MAMIAWWWYPIAALAILGCAALSLQIVLYRLFIRVVRQFKSVTAEDPVTWPHLSVVVAACNEAETIGSALLTLCDQNYPNFELVVVNDRSTDGTGEVIENLARSDDRIKMVQVDTLPEGWLGKVNAMHCGLQAATGEWILFTDADVRFGPNLLKKSMAIAEAEALDHLALIPNLMSERILTNMVIGTSLRGVVFGGRAWLHKDPKSEHALGAGPFNMVRRSALDKTPGFEWLRMEVSDDVGFGIMLKKAGAKSEILAATEELIVPWYSDLKSAFLGLEKNAFANIARYSLLRGMFFSTAMLIMVCAPYLAFLPMPWSWMWMVGVFGFSSYFLSCVYFCRWANVPFWTYLFSQPFGDLMISALIFWASWRGWRRGGLLWRGTVYPSSLLREGVRVKFF